MQSSRKLDNNSSSSIPYQQQPQILLHSSSIDTTEQYNTVDTRHNMYKHDTGLLCSPNTNTNTTPSALTFSVYDNNPISNNKNKVNSHFANVVVTNQEHQESLHLPFSKKGQQRSRSIRKAFCQVILGVICVITILMHLTGANYTAGAMWNIVHQEGLNGIRSLDGFTRVCHKIVDISETEMFNTLLIVAVIYIVLQTFCIPGTLFLNALVGALVGVILGIPITVFLGTIGATCCYLLSYFVGITLVEGVDNKLMKGKGLPIIRASVQRYKSDLFVYLLFLRLAPVLPNWLINLASPIVNVPLSLFTAATFSGIIPQTYLAVRFGSVVRQSFLIVSSNRVDSDGKGRKEGLMEIITIWDSLLLITIAVAILVVYRLKKKFCT